jgi:hypothetical protein
MTTQSYLIIESGVVTNIVMWDGSTTSWTPPAGSTQLVHATTPIKIWEEVSTLVNDEVVFEWQIVEKLGAPDPIGFTWDGTCCMTNKPNPGEVLIRRIPPELLNNTPA